MICLFSCKKKLSTLVLVIDKTNVTKLHLVLFINEQTLWRIKATNDTSDYRLVSMIRHSGRTAYQGEGGGLRKLGQCL